MLDQLQTIAKQILEVAGSAVGVRSGTEEPAYQARRLADKVEIRQYGPRIAAQTTVTADEESARSVGFRRLARYIFGANDGQWSIAMTAPVAVASQKAGTKIAMTAPVAQHQDADGSWVVRFFMPSQWTLDTLPAPSDGRVELTVVEPERFAVLRFSGDRDPATLKRRTSELRNLLRYNGIESLGPAAAWFYDPPWTLPWLRRNEIAVLLP